ncbi:MAG: hypothetical protein LBS41_05495 [Streptococcaceae bacterium]|jgi:hypothetical protein|nr:hypothetical protein [Streptococcaceae bacterium]
MRDQNNTHEHKKRIRSRVLALASIFLLVAGQLLTAAVPLLLLFPDRIVAATEVQSPVIDHQPVGGTFAKGAPLRLIVQAHSDDAGHLTYQWETKAASETEWRDVADEPDGAVGSDDDTIGKTAILNKVFTPEQVGTYSYRCKVTNTLSGNSAHVYTAETSVTVIDEIAAATYDTSNGKKTNGTAYTADDLQYYNGTKAFNQLYPTLLNGNFESGTTGNSYARKAGASNTVAYWDTTRGAVGSDDIKMLTITKGSGSTLGYATIANTTIYQEVATQPGRIYNWQFQQGGTASSAKNICAVIIGPASVDTTTIWPYGVDGSDDPAHPAEALTTQDNTFSKIIDQLKTDNGLTATTGDSVSDTDYDAWAALNDRQFAVTYLGHTYSVALTASTGTAFAAHSGSGTIPEGQGRTIVGVTTVAAQGGSANVGGFSVTSSPELEVSPTLDYSGAKHIKIQAQAGRAYALAEVRGTIVTNLASDLLNQTTFAGSQITPIPANTTNADDPTYATLGDGTWFYPNSAGELSFNGLESGKTYRVVSVPVGVISKAFGTNDSPTLVLDDANYKDLTIPAGTLTTSTTLGTITSGVKVGESSATGQIEIDKCEPNTQYALLKKTDGKWDTTTPVKDWMTGSVDNHSIKWDELNLSLGSDPTDYLVVSRPAPYTEITYQDAIASGVKVSFINPFNQETPSNSSWEIKANQVVRTSNQMKITLDKPLTNTDHGKGKVDIYDLITGQHLGAATKGSSNIYTLTIPTANQGHDLVVCLSAYDNVAKAVNAYAAPETLLIDYGNEIIYTTRQEGENTLKVIPTDIDYHMGNGTTFEQGTGVQPYSLTALLNTSPSETARTFHYTKHFDHATAVGEVSTLVVPARPAGPTVLTTGSPDVKIDYPNEQLTTARDDLTVNTVGSEKHDLPTGTTKLNDTRIGWQEIKSHAVEFGIKASDTAFTSAKTAYTIVAKAEAVTIGGVEVIDVGDGGQKLNLTTIKRGDTLVSGNYEYQINGTGTWYSLTVASGGTATINPFVKGNSYYIREKATDNAPASMRMTEEGGIISVQWVENMTAIYGQTDQTSNQGGMGKIILVNRSTTQAANQGGINIINDTSTAFSNSGLSTGSDSLAAGESKNFTVWSNGALDAGAYTANLQVTYKVGDDTTTEYKATAMMKTTIGLATWGENPVTLPTKANVEAGTAGSVTDTTLTLTLTLTNYTQLTGANLEYRLNNSAWTTLGAVTIGTSTLALTDLHPASSELVEVRVAADQNHHVSTIVSNTYYTRFKTPDFSDLRINYVTEIYDLPTENGGYTFQIAEPGKNNGNTFTAMNSSGSLTELLNDNVRWGIAIKLTHNAYTDGSGIVIIPASATFQTQQDTEGSTNERGTNMYRRGVPTLTTTPATAYQSTSDGIITNTGDTEAIDIAVKGSSVAIPANHGHEANNLASGEYTVRKIPTADQFASLSKDVVVEFGGYMIEVDVGDTDGEQVTMPGATGVWTQNGSRYSRVQSSSAPATYANTGPQRSLYRGFLTHTSGTATTTLETGLLIAADLSQDRMKDYVDPSDGVIRYGVKWVHLPAYTVTIPESITASHYDASTKADITVKTEYMPENERSLTVSTADKVAVTNSGETLELATSFDSKGADGASATSFTLDTDVEDVAKLTINRATTTPTKSGAYTGTLNFNFAVDDVVMPGTSDIEQDFYYTGEVQSFTALRAGTYQFEAWGAGAQYLNNSEKRSKGAYTKGEITLEAGQIVYIYVGESTAEKRVAFNGGATGTTGSNTDRWTAGGGATDFRITQGDNTADWNKNLSLNSRIMVAGGGGGSAYDGSTNATVSEIIGGAGGGLTGINGSYYEDTNKTGAGVAGLGGGQTAGGAAVTTTYATVNTSTAGAFGTGGIATNANVSGGGGGWYGGSSGARTSGTGAVTTGGGGSSFISGYSGCVAIADPSNDTANPRTHKTGDNSSVMTLGGRDYVFTSTSMIAGNATIPSWQIAGTQVTGNAGNGHARITFKR